MMRKDKFKKYITCKKLLSLSRFSKTKIVFLVLGLVFLALGMKNYRNPYSKPFSEKINGSQEINKVFSKRSNCSFGFWDSGFIKGIVRTDYNSQTEGTEGNPLTIAPCQFNGGDSLLISAGPSWGGKGCLLAPTVYSKSNAFTNAGVWPERDFWVLSVNNEPAYLKDYNSGPPNQSLPISEPGKGIVGFTIKKDKVKGKSVSKAILALDHTFAPKGSEGYIPFLAIGADKNKGNGKAITVLNPSKKNIPQKVSFTVEMLKKKNITNRQAAGVFWFIASAKWDGISHMVFVALFHENIEHERAGINFIHGHWNWNIKESFYYPGGDLVYMDAEDISAIGSKISRITSVNQKYTYTIDLQELFEVASKNVNGVTFDTLIPQSKNIPVTSVHWAVEMTGKNTELWFSIQGIHIE